MFYTTGKILIMKMEFASISQRTKIVVQKYITSLINYPTLAFLLKIITYSNMYNCISMYNYTLNG